MKSNEKVFCNLVLSVALCASATGCFESEKVPFPIGLSPLTEAQIRTQKVLAILESDTVGVHFPNESFDIALQFLRERTKLNIVVDHTIDTPQMRTNIMVSNMKLGRFLSLILRQNDLAYYVHDGVIRVVDSCAVKPDTVLTIYDVSDICVKHCTYADVLADQITESVRIDILDYSWGDIFKAMVHCELLFIVADEDVHARCVDFLENYGKVRVIPVDFGKAGNEFFLGLPIDLQEKLNAPLSIHFDRVPFDKAIDRIQEKAGIRISCYPPDDIEYEVDLSRQDEASAGFYKKGKIPLTITADFYDLPVKTILEVLCDMVGKTPCGRYVTNTTPDGVLLGYSKIVDIERATRIYKVRNLAVDESFFSDKENEDREIVESEIRNAVDDLGTLVKIFLPALHGPWDDGADTIRPFLDTLIITTDEVTHRKIEILFDAIEKSRCTDRVPDKGSSG